MNKIMNFKLSFNRKKISEDLNKLRIKEEFSYCLK